VAFSDYSCHGSWSEDGNRLQYVIVSPVGGETDGVKRLCARIHHHEVDPYEDFQRKRKQRRQTDKENKDGDVVYDFYFERNVTLVAKANECPWEEQGDQQDEEREDGELLWKFNLSRASKW
jgi:hypothetical protein